jgi:hypothetical protein
VVKQYMSKSTNEIIFEFFDPTDALCILATMSPLAADRKNLQLFARYSDWHEDFCDGEACTALKTLYLMEAPLYHLSSFLTELIEMSKVL